MNGTTGNDQILITQAGSTYTIHNGSWTSTVTGSFSKVVVKGAGGDDAITLDATVTENADLYGDAGNDTISGGGGSDRVFGGAGSNVLSGGYGYDTIVTIGSTSDTVSGGLGYDTFWMDNSPYEVITDQAASEAGLVHRVSSFLGGVTTLLAGQNLADPKTTDASMVYKNFATSPLFGASGPLEDDISQGYVGDCWFLSSVASVAKLNPGRIRQMMVDLGDGTYAVQFTRNGQKVFARVDADLPTWSSGSLAYADFGKGGSLWVAILEKAMTEYRGTGDGYDDIDGGWMTEAFSAMGLVGSDINGTSASDLVNKISAALAAGRAVTYAVGTVPAGAPLIGNHAYTVDHMGHDSKGNVVVVLRNPWGVDGAGSDGANDGYVTVTPQQLYAASLGAASAAV